MFVLVFRLASPYWKLLQLKLMGQKMHKINKLTLPFLQVIMTMRRIMQCSLSFPFFGSWRRGWHDQEGGWCPPPVKWVDGSNLNSQILFSFLKIMYLLKVISSVRKDSQSKSCMPYLEVPKPSCQHRL